MPNKREPYNPLLKSYPDSERVNAVSEGAEILFVRLIAQSDDLNHYYGEAAMVLGKLFTRRMCAGQVTLKEVDRRIGELAEARLIETYEADGRRYIEIVNCRKDLRSDVKPDVRFPARPSNSNGSDSARIRPGFVSPTQPNPTQPNPTETIPLPAVAGADSLPSGFARFWSSWPKHFRKQGRKKCLALWKKQKLEPAADQVADALQRCKASRDWQKNSGEFIPFPLTWLNRTPWETDPAEMVSEEYTPSAEELDPADAAMIEEMYGSKP